MVKVNPKNEVVRLHREARESVAQYLTAAFGLVAGLAWNEAIKALIDGFVPVGTNTLVAKFIYAGAVTLFAVIVGAYLIRILKPKG